jgi:type II secretion system protein J
MIRPLKNSGFTLVELLIATVIGALVVVVAIATFRSVSRSRETARYYSDVMAQGRYALDQIRDDLANFYRSSDPEQMRLTGIKGGTIEQPADRLIMCVVSDRPLKSRIGESGIYEVEYGLSLSELNGENPQGILARRCAALTYPEQINQQGMLTQIAGAVTSLKFEYFDGTSWYRQWQSPPEPPRLIRVSIILADEHAERKSILLSQEISLEPLPVMSD